MAKEQNNTTSPDNVPASKKSGANKKKKIILTFIALCLVGVISYAATENPGMFTPSYWARKFAKEEPASMYSNKITSFSFYPSDYAEDVTTDAVYMSLNRYMQFQNGMETVTVTDGNYAAYGDIPEFFGKYFETVVAGDADTYNTYFTDGYYEANDPYDRFTPQKIYDILVTQKSATVNDDGTTTYGCDVSYKIRRNTGTFRNDIDSDASKTLYYELLLSGGEMKINRITYYVKG